MSAAHLGAAVDEPATPPPTEMPAGEEDEAPAVVADAEQPGPKPYAADGRVRETDQTAAPATDDEVATFDAEQGHLQTRAAVARTARDDRQRPILCTSTATCSVGAFDQGAVGVRAVDGPSPYEHAHRLATRCVEINQAGCVEDDAMIQHERAVKFDFHTGHAHCGTLKAWAHRSRHVRTTGPRRARAARRRGLCAAKGRYYLFAGVCGWAC